jgi:hypothetical protein
VAIIGGVSVKKRAMSCCQIVGRVVRRFAVEQTSRHTKRRSAAGIGVQLSIVSQVVPTSRRDKTDNSTETHDVTIEIRRDRPASSRWHEVGFSPLRA